MKITAILAAVVALVSAAAAAPAPPPESERFYIYSTSNDTRFDNLCIGAYHTGAGFADAVFGACSKAFKKNLYYQTGKAVYFVGYSEKYPSGVQFSNGIISYNEWDKVTINVGAPTKDFVYTTGEGFLQKSYGYGFLMCKWSHQGSPQLFALGVEEPTPLANCAKVKIFKAHST